MKSRTCPNCDYRYTRWEYFRFLRFKGVDSVWHCKGCGTPLKINVNRRTGIAFVSMLPVIIAAVAISLLKEVFKISMFWQYGILLLVALIWIFWVYSFDKFDLDKK